MQCVREREMRHIHEMNQMNEMNQMEQGEQMNLSQSLPTNLSSEDRLFMSIPVLRPGHGHMLEQDLASLTSAMTDMSVCMEEVSTCKNIFTLFTFIIKQDPMQSCESPADPHSQASKRTDPVYRATAQYGELGKQQQQYLEHQQSNSINN